MREHHSPRNRARLVLISVLALGAILAIISFLFLRIGLENFKTEGSTIRPTRAAGDYLLVNKFSFLPANRGEVIVFQDPAYPRRSFVKRVIGVPGDRTSINEGTVWVNGVALPEPYITARDTRSMSE